MNVIEGGKPVEDIKGYVCAGMADVTVGVTPQTYMPTSPPGSRGRNCSFFRDFVLYRCSSGVLSAAMPFDAEAEKGAEKGEGLACCESRR